MTRTIIAGTYVLALACDATAQPASDAAWNECLKTPARACVLREAAEVASGIADPDLAASELGEIAATRLKAGLSADTEMAAERSLANSIAEDRFRDDALERLAQLQAQADMLNDALKTAASIKNSYLQAEALGAIAVAEGKAGRLDEALRRVQAIEDLPRRADILRRVAWDLRDSAVARGDDDKIVAALDGVQAIEEQYHLWPGPRTGFVHASEFVPALAIIAQAQARAGKFADAMRVARQVTGSMQRAQAFAAIAVALARAGAVGSALQVARARRPLGARRGARANPRASTNARHDCR
jgi:hypothetical protein